MKISIMLIGSLTLFVLMHGHEDPDGYISIDCGAPTDYSDDSIHINFKTDAGFIDTGESKQVSTDVIYEYNYQYAKNLRIFPNGTRNCYTLRPKQGKGNTYLVRATFWYGNYDGTNQPPVFDLYVDTNYWTTVDWTDYTYSELTYVAPRDYIQVCLVNIKKGVPFISALELRPLVNSPYTLPLSGALHTYLRNNFGSNITYRHPLDDFDRIWANVTYKSFTSVTNTTPIATPTSNDAYKVPEQVLMTAQEASDISENLTLFWTSEPGIEWYAYFHLAEVQDLKNQVRQMDIYMNSKYVDTVSLQNQVPLTVVSEPATGYAINFSLSATSQSDLPPLLNALEVFKVVYLSSSQTDLSDFEGINAIKTTYGIDKMSWQGDPCVPQNMTWEGVNCSYDDNAPRIILLNLSSSNLAGIIAASFSNLTAIVSLDLSNNQLTGEIPDFLVKLSNLRILNLSGNNLKGSIPKAIKKRVDSKTLQLSLDGNAIDPNSTINAGKRNTNKTLLIVAPVIGLAVLILFGVAGFFWWGIKKRRGHGPSNQSKLKAKNRPFAYNEVLRITNNFNMNIGEGSFGKVYLGTLDNGIKVAVKMLSHTSKQGYKEFEAEAQLLMIIHHKNLVSLVGYCDDIRNMALIYEYMPAGNLRENLSEKSPNTLSWVQRLQIAVDAALGLDYLHHGCRPPIIHRDLKPPNILLNENMQAKIADFGLSKAFGTENESFISTRPAGTPGYLDPEFQSSGNLCRKSDVYSFGIILFELITGHPAILQGVAGNKHILHWVTPLIQRGDIESITDPRLMGQFNVNSAWKVVEIAMSCVSATAIQRPDINDVLHELKECLDMEIRSSSSRSDTNGVDHRSSFHESFRMTTLELDFDNTPLVR